MDLGRTKEPFAVEVSVECEAWLAVCPNAAAITAAAARAALSQVAGPPGGRLQIVGVVLTNDTEQRRLNRTYRGIDQATNVLSFAIADPATPPDMPMLLGDVVLALETVEHEANEQRKPLANHLAHLVVHGVLHLLGFDHDCEAAATIMEAREVQILKSLGVPDPYCSAM